MQSWLFLLSLGLVGLLLAACVEPVGSGTGLTESGRLAAAPTPIDTANPDPVDPGPVDTNALAANFFANQVLPIFQENCTQCHSPGSQGYNYTKLTLELDKAYAALVNVPSTEMKAPRPEMLLVKPGMPDSSFLYNKIAFDKPLAFARMPLQKPKLSATDIDIIKKWIEGGSPEN